ncbi:type II/IV secretion system-related protein [Polycladomyces abyssicola]|uniref:Type II/IV secretion system-related protein n=1 Tax=Polycladomyces abyssicola TaxID=1125966 RepID=A0A8D5ZME0_9BACL|nr:CpaF family protein [Polycladomyces abyssicola]BCU80326.1 type II/IV secretion system-related protein [Polycladomyces abyssicola]
MALFDRIQNRPQKTRRRSNQAQSLSSINQNRIDQLAQHFKARLLRETDLEKLTQLPSNELRITLDRIVGRYLADEQVVITRQERDRLISKIIDESVGYGPLEPLLMDEEITEIVVNGPEEVYYEKNGKLHKTDIKFRDEEALRHVIDRIVAPIGRRIDVSSPMVDARLPDGSRVNAVIPPIALKGSLLSIRKFRKDPIRMDDLIRFGSLTPDMAQFLTSLVRAKLNLIISGGTGSGKTTLLNALACFIPENERIITIEDMAELRIPHGHVAGMEARPANVEGKGEITIRQLVRNALRMRPDRIIVGEVRGAEAFDMLQAMNTGHEGSLTTIHANSPDDAMRRLEGMVMMSSLDLPAAIIREYIVGAVDFIIQIGRLPDGQRKMLSIAEIQKDDQGHFEMKEIFRFNQTGVKEDGTVVGYFSPTGILPKCLPRLKAYGVPVDPKIFRPVRGDMQ